MSPHTTRHYRPPRPLPPPHPTLAPSPTFASGTTSRPHATPVNSSHRTPPLPSGPRSPSKRNEAPTSAEAYASAHSRRDRASKPIFDWITRKLTVGRRAIVAVPISPPTTRTITTPPRMVPAPRTRAKPPPLATLKPPQHLSPAQIFASVSPTRDNATFISRTESHSLRSYSLSYANSTERDRRREANNPYPSIPVQAYRGSTIASGSVSFLSRSRSLSLRSDSSVRRRSMIDDASSYRLGRGPDEDASIRRLPPASPVQSNSVMSRSASASLLSPIYPSSYRPSSPPFSPRSVARHSASSSPGPELSFSSSDPDNERDARGRQSRRDSTSTKPTTVLSFDSGPHVAHIATAPQAPIPSFRALATRSGPPVVGAGQIRNDLTIAPALVPSTIPSSTSPSPAVTLAQAPKRSAPHPRDNPHPTAPPDPNASTLTLASSTFAQGSNRNLTASSIHRPVSAVRPSSLSTSPSVTFAPDRDRPLSVNEYPPSAPALSSLRTGWGRVMDRDTMDRASVVAIRRKGSWQSDESGWSWRAAQAGEAGHGISKSIAQSPSVDTGSVLEDGEGRGSTLETGTFSTAGTGPGTLLTRESFKTAQTRFSEPDGSPRLVASRFDLGEPGVLLTA
ncbi:MAG: hypothetical protein TREMPRED_002360 [Tremellales sp. Tagirdzhanova-0007]|nr:MAG: hypothetical protein TREMPRED_002360 [Tremellales sp. Tagirdzhanova-0007]